MGCNVAVDLETLGTTPGSIIVSIGAVKFTDDFPHMQVLDDSMDGQMRHQMQNEFYRVISVSSAGAVGLTFSHKTMAWWMRQGAQARQALIDALEGGDHAQDIRQVMGDFKAWIEAGQTMDEIWAWGQMDITMLTALYDRMGVADVWGGEKPYKKENDARTLVTQLGLPLRDKVGTHHNALDDAKWLAQMVVDAKKYIKRAADGARMIEHMQMQQQLANASMGLPQRDAYGHKLGESIGEAGQTGETGTAEFADTQDRAEGDE